MGVVLLVLLFVVSRVAGKSSDEDLCTIMLQNMTTWCGSEARRFQRSLNDCAGVPMANYKTCACGTTSFTMMLLFSSIPDALAENGLRMNSQLLNGQSWQSQFVGRDHSPWLLLGNASDPCWPKPKALHGNTFQQLACMLGIFKYCPMVEFAAPKIVQAFIQWAGSMTHILTIQWSGPNEYRLLQSWVGAYDLFEWLTQTPGARNFTQKSSFSGTMDALGMERYFDTLENVTSGRLPWNAYKSEFEDLFWTTFETPEEHNITCFTAQSQITAGVGVWEYFYDPFSCERNLNLYLQLCDIPSPEKDGCKPLSACIAV